MKNNIILPALLIAISVLVILSQSGCSDATVASHNLSKAAEQFELDRRIVFYNGITGEYMLVIHGKCSVEQDLVRLGVTCKTGPEEYKKHYLGLSDNVTYFSEQLNSKNVSVYNYRVIFKPQVIVPDVDLKVGS
jgi:hypothetical protein